VKGARAVVVVDVDGDGFPTWSRAAAAGLALLRGGPDGLVDASAAAGLRAPARALASAPATSTTTAGRPLRDRRRRAGRSTGTSAAPLRRRHGGRGRARARAGRLLRVRDVDRDATPTSSWPRLGRLPLARGAPDLALGARDRLREPAAAPTCTRPSPGLASGTATATGPSRGRPPSLAGRLGSAALPFEREAGLDLLVSCGLRTAGPRDLTASC